MESKEIGTGAFGVFTRELVEANHLWQANGGVNVQVRTFSYTCFHPQNGHPVRLDT
jgi:hypothetical protein